MLTKLYQLEHFSYICQYHIVQTPRYRGKVLADNYIKQELKRIFKFIANWKGFYFGPVVHWRRSHSSAHSYSTQILSCICNHGSQIQICQLGQKENEEVPKRQSLGTRLLCFYCRNQQTSINKLHQQSRPQKSRRRKP